MKPIYLRSFTNQFHLYCLDGHDLTSDSIHNIKEEVLSIWNIPVEEQSLYHNGRIIHNIEGLERLECGSTIDIGLSLQGGKGGFGSLLRGQATSKRKITNFDASRDLQGRRIRHVKQHQKMLEWAQKRKQEEKMVKAELDEFNKQQKEIKSVERNIKLSQEFKDKVDKWENELGSSVKAGLKKAKGKEDEVLEEFAAPKKKLKSSVDKSEKLDFDSKIMQKLTSILEEKVEDGQTVEKVTVVEKEVVKVGDAGNGKEEAGNGKANGEKVEFENIDLAKIQSQGDLEALGNEHLKHELMRLGLKCGGNLQEKAKRLYDIKMKPELLFHPKYIAKK